MRKTAATILAVLVYMSTPTFAAGPPPTDDDPAELTDVYPYQCASDVPEADLGMVDMACDDEPQAESMTSSGSASLQTSCTFCTNFCKGNSACFNCCCFGYGC